jgi:adenosylcobyric acid synthase
MSQSIMLQGTASDVGKSVLVAGLCRIFAQDGHLCAPFKAQNMALNSGITATGDEMGRAQIFQAEAAGIAPDVRMNPILLKPTSDCESQVIVLGQVLCDMDAIHYHRYKPRLRQQVQDVYQSLSREYDIMVLEGAGSPAEINLRDADLVNMGMAIMADAPVILVADIDRGGVFASIYGTLALLSDAERARVKGVIINKFRGDVALLMPGIRQIEAMTRVPVLGVMPFLNLDLEDEDGVVLQSRADLKQPYNQPAEYDLDIVVIQVPHISNFTDFNPLSAQPDVRLRYASRPEQIGSPDLIILPGSKNTLGDLGFLYKTGLAEQILECHAIGVPIMGICGGFQMLGRRLIDGVESGIDEMKGLGLLDCETVFASRKVTTQILGQIDAQVSGLFAAMDSGDMLPLSGYEIHMGETSRGADARPFTLIASRNGQPVQIEDGAVNDTGTVAGTYIHGLFDNERWTRSLLNRLRQGKGLAALPENDFCYRQYKEQQFDMLANAMRQNIDIHNIYQIMDAQQQRSSV